MKLHLCCGDIYLKDYINVDVEGKLVEECTLEELEANRTTLNTYFKYEFGTPRRPIILDQKLNLLDKWSYKDESVDEIVMISCLEHFTKEEALHIISEIKRVLKPNSVLKIDFPDIKKDVELYHDTNPEFLMELIYCNWKNIYSAHKYGYTEKMFRDLLGLDFDCVRKEIVKHDYPMIGMICTKVG